MPRKNRVPWLDYTGQDTAAILACKGTHRIDSLLSALEEGIQLRQNRHPEVATTPEERTLLAIMALQREVNNGGYHQFFVNSSRQYALTIVPALKSIGCEATAALTERALDALGLEPITLQAIQGSIFKPNAERDGALDALDQEYYAGLGEIEANLWAFVEGHEQAFALEKMAVAPPPPQRGNHNLILLGVGLDFAPKTELTFEAVRTLAAEIAIQKEIAPTPAELDGAAYLFLFKWFLKAGDMERSEAFSGPAFELTREDTSHCVLQRQWVEKLIELANFARADEVTMQYLEYLKGDDTAIDFIKNRIKFWADPLRKHGNQLPKSSEFFRANFPDVSLTAPPTPALQWVKGKSKNT